MIQPQLFEVFIQFEEHASSLYLDLSARFGENLALSWFWIEMAMDEKQHAGLLQFCKEAGTVISVVPTDEQIQHLGGLFKELSAKATKPDLALDEAFDIAIAVESSEINEIFDNLIKNITGPLYVIRKKVELAINHFTKLREAGVRFGVSKSILERLADLEQREDFVRGLVK